MAEVWSHTHWQVLNEGRRKNDSFEQRSRGAINLPLKRKREWWLLTKRCKWCSETNHWAGVVGKISSDLFYCHFHLWLIPRSKHAWVLYDGYSSLFKIRFHLSSCLSLPWFSSLCYLQDIRLCHSIIAVICAPEINIRLNPLVSSEEILLSTKHIIRERQTEHANDIYNDNNLLLVSRTELSMRRLWSNEIKENYYPTPAPFLSSFPRSPLKQREYVHQKKLINTQIYAELLPFLVWKHVIFYIILFSHQLVKPFCNIE